VIFEARKLKEHNIKKKSITALSLLKTGWWQHSWS